MCLAGEKLMSDIIKTKKLLLKLISQYKSIECVSTIIETIKKDFDNTDIVLYCLEVMPIIDGVDYYEKIRFVEKTKSNEVLVRLVDFYGDTNCSGSCGFIIDIIKSSSSDHKLKASAIKALGNVGEKEDIKLIIPYLDHDKKEMICSALYCCGKLGNRSLLPRLSKFQNSNIHESIQMATIQCYFDLGEISEIIKFFYFVSSSQNVKLSIINYLGRFNNENALSTLKKILDSKEIVFRIAAIRAIEQMGDFSVFEYVVENYNYFPVLYQSHLLNSSITLLHSHKEEGKQMIEKKIKKYVAKSIATELDKIDDKIFGDIFFKLLSMKKKNINYSEIKQLNKLLDEVSKDIHIYPYYFRLLIDSEDTDLRKKFHDYADKKHLIRKEKFPEPEDIIFYLKMINSSRIKGMDALALYLLGDSSKTVKIHALECLLKTGKPNSFLIEIIEWLYLNTDEDNIKKIILEIISKFVIKQHFSTFEEHYPSESETIKKSLLIELGKMGVKNNIYVVKNLADVSEKKEACGVIEAAGLLKEAIPEEIARIKEFHNNDIEITLEMIRYYYRLTDYNTGNSLLFNIFRSGNNEDIVKAINFFFNEHVPVDVYKEILSMLSEKSNKLVNTASKFLQKRADLSNFTILVEYFNRL